MRIHPNRWFVSRRSVAGIDAQYEAEYAGLRMKELELSDMRMKTGVALRPATGASQSSAKKFGELFELEPEALVDFVEKEDPNVLVFIHIYQKVRILAANGELKVLACSPLLTPLILCL